MKLTNLLTGAAVAALLTGAANAQLVVADTDGDNAVEFASQVDLAAAAYQDELTITLSAADYTAITGLAPTDDVNLTLTLDGGLSFSTFLSNANSTQAGAANASCVFVIDAGGANGGQSVSFAGDVAFDPTSCTQGLGVENIQIALPIDIEGVGNVAYELTLDSTGAVLASGEYNAAVAPATQDFLYRA